jgi:cyclic pyranopterin phosphate synthase
VPGTPRTARARTRPAGRRSALTHVDATGRARMVDVSEKPLTRRTAVARGWLRVSPEAMRRARAGRLPKGGVVEVARIAGITAAKRTSEAIPLCHPLPLAHVDVRVTPRKDGFDLEAAVVTVARTGAEMEALHAVAIAGLTVYDMMKAVDRGMTLTDVRVVKKTGGRRGDYEAR